MRKLFLVCILILGSSIIAWACRYTVREIGFSSLSNSLYSIVLIDGNIDPRAPEYNVIRKQLADSNIGLIILDPAKDQEHPAIKRAKLEGLSFPYSILWTPLKDRIYLPKEQTLQKLVDEVLYSILRNKISSQFYNHFAITVLVESHDQEMNTTALSILQKSCDDINNRMPNMPKQVEHGAQVLSISASDWKNERVFLWALGIEKIPENPIAFIIYGRGRIIGNLIDFTAIQKQAVFKRLAMIGADCECGLDRKWMLGPQIPMNWSLENRQLLTDELGFDVDNPMVLAEMSHILSKEQITEFNSDVTFAPEEIDLDLLLNKKENIGKSEDQTKERLILPTVLIILGLSILIIIIGFLLFRRKR